MEHPDPPKRKYQSTRRKEQARETRQRILEAALKCFSKHGYAGATIEAIAQEANVSPLTVFSIFKNKHSILTALVGYLVGGDEQPIPLMERPGPRAVLADPDAHHQVRGFAADISNILERVWPVFEIMRMAAKTEPEIAGLLHQVLENRMRNLGIFVHHVADNTPLRAGLSEAQATEMVWTIASPDVYRLLTVDRGWSKDQFSNWLGETLARLLLPD